MNGFVHIAHIEGESLLRNVGAIGDINCDGVIICCLMIETTSYFDFTA